MEEHYSNDADFFGLFEADTFDVEEHDNGNFRGYVYDEAGERVLAGTFDYDSTGEGGWGWYDDTVI